MNILIIEDEMRIARRLARMTAQYFEQQSANIILCDDLEAGLKHLDQHDVNLLLLDLNLNGEDGFQVLEVMVARSFQTIIVSAYTEKAITAFAYGVLDFVPKPFDEERLFQAFGRLTAAPAVPENQLKFLAIRNSGLIRLIDVAEVAGIEAAGIYSELHLKNGTVALHDKSLDALERILPANDFVRIHRSHIIRWAHAEKLIIEPGGKYAMQLKNGNLLPVGRSRYKALCERLRGYKRW